MDCLKVLNFTNIMSECLTEHTERQMKPITFKTSQVAVHTCLMSHVFMDVGLDNVSSTILIDF